MKLDPNKVRLVADTIEYAVAGSCQIIDYEYWYDTYGVDEDRVNQILIDAEIENCVACGWWIHGHDRSDKDFDEIVCKECENDY
jgi:hypothetical protein